MSRTPRVIGAAGAVAVAIGMTMIGVSGAAGAGSAPAYSRVAGSVAPFAASAQVIGAVPSSRPLTVQLWLRPALAAAERMAAAVSTPASPLYHHYLSPARYTAEFGASPARAQAVESWLRAQGFTGVHADAQRAYVRATAPTATIERAFRVRMQLFRSSQAVNAGRYALRSNDRAISLPSALAASVAGVTGLDNAAPKSTLLRVTHMPAASQPAPAGHGITFGPCSQFYGQHTTGGLPRHFGITTFPTEVCGYSAQQMRAAYGANMRNTGKGQTVALVELGLAPRMFQTLTDYAAHNGMPAPSADPLLRARDRPGLGLRRPVRRGGAARRRVLVRHGSRPRTRSWWAVTAATSATSASRACSTPTWPCSAAAATRSRRSPRTRGRAATRPSRPT